MTDTIFQVTDLANRRTEFVQAARQGGARLRDKDGTSLLMLPERRVTLLEALSRWNSNYMRLEAIIKRGGLPSVTDLGDLAWLRVFDVDDLEEFVRELHDALVAAGADDDLRAVDTLVADWRITAAQLVDPLRRSVLLNPVIDGRDLVEAVRPDAT